MHAWFHSGDSVTKHLISDSDSSATFCQYIQNCVQKWYISCEHSSVQCAQSYFCLGQTKPTMQNLIPCPFEILVHFWISYFWQCLKAASSALFSFKIKTWSINIFEQCQHLLSANWQNINPHWFSWTKNSINWPL